MPSSEPVLLRIKQIIARQLDIGVGLEEIPDEASLMEGKLAVDSIVLYEFISLLEREFNFEFPDQDLGVELFSSLNRLSGYVEVKSRVNQ